MKKVVIIGLIFCALIVLLGKYVLNNLSGTSPEPPDCKPVAVKRGVISLRISGRGLITPKQNVVVKTKRRGQIQSILVRQGVKVTKGQRLLRIKPEAGFTIKLHDLRLSLHNVRNKTKTTEKNLQRQRRLYSEGLVALMAVESAKESYEQALRQMDVIEEKVKVYEKETGLKISGALEGEPLTEPIYSYITAPISGTVIAIHTDVGDMVPSRPSSLSDYHDEGLLTIADLSQYLVEYKVSEIDINKIKIGQTAEVRLDPYPDKVYYGDIDEVSVRARPRTATRYARERSGIYYFTVKILLKKTDPRFRPGMSCRVSIIFQEKQDILLTPVEAIARIGGREFAYVMQSDSFIRQRVITGISDDSFVEITSDLPEGTLLCNRPLMVLEWEELRRLYQNRSFIEKMLK